MTMPKSPKLNRRRVRPLRAAVSETLESRLLLASSYYPGTAAELTSDLSLAQLGDTIVLNAGTTYTGNFVMKNKTSGTGWITLISSNIAAMPDGVRVGPA